MKQNKKKQLRCSQRHKAVCAVCEKEVEIIKVPLLKDEPL